MRTRLLLAGATAIFAVHSASASAANIKDPWRFEVIQDKCSIRAAFDDGTYAAFSYEQVPQGTKFLALRTFRAGFNLADGEKAANISIRGKGNFPALVATSVGAGDGLQLQALSWTDYEGMLNNLASGASYRVTIGGRVMGDFPLTGSAKAIEGLRQCAGLPGGKATGSRTGVMNPNSSSRSAPPRMTQPETASTSTAKQIDRLIFRDSRRWMFNRYKAGGVHETTVTERVDGENYTIRAYYWYNGRQRGYVDVFVIDGRFDCMRYHDNPTVCVPVN
ncbi:hypothetical protein A6F65_01466 [Paraurantiacibacter namhicola]|uniref:Uncharacterized protein n=2 Tax=Paraurantiacibacter namhicola TaxID=645517 RepID=A0A1C7D8G5_9SPHN|nr:hypothetical protein A6F65_01466 [Paraurantiacibacter namhicola]